MKILQIVAVQETFVGPERHIDTADGATIFGLGDDGLVYRWDYVNGGWVCWREDPHA